VRPPVRDPRFWALQGLVLALVAGHFAVDVASDRTTTVPAGIPVALLLVPVSYAALRFGLVGSVATAAWATLLWLPDLLLPRDRGHVGNDLIELTLVCAVAVFVGQHMDTEQKERERARRFASLLLKAQEEEQRRIAQELHDEPLQLLVDLSRTLDEAALAVADTPALGAKLIQAREEVLDISARVRAVVLGLRPPALDKLGLTPALRGLVAAADNTTDADVDLTIGEDGHRLPPDVELGVYRIAQEALNNAIRHGHPRRVSLTFDHNDSQVRLQVADDGRGFDGQTLEPAASPDSFGLIGMHERAELLGGRLKVRSAPAEGTVVDLTMAVHPQMLRGAWQQEPPPPSTRRQREPPPNGQHDRR
jgi:signal transduction histidine kinase